MEKPQTIEINIGAALDIMAEASKHQPNSYTIEGKYYYDYYTEIAHRMFVDNTSTLMADGHFFKLGEPEKSTPHIYTSFGKLTCYKLT